jgi:hypothetical protein
MTRSVVGRRLAAWLMPALLVGVMSLAACGASSTSTQATPTPTLSAQQILQNADHATISDMAFTLSGTENISGTTGSITGSAKVTKSPARVEMTITIPYTGTQLSVSFIVDAPTSTVYIKFGPNALGVPSNVWYKDSTTGTLGSSFASIGSQLTSPTNYTNLQNPTLVGSETINGVAVWHIRGTDSSGSTPTAGATSTSGVTDDLYLRQDNYYPVKVVITGDGANLTVNVTSVNTGITITLPANAQPFP